MRVHARLNVTDDRVLCPSTCRWEPVDHCALCRKLAALERRSDGETVVDCRPEVVRLATTVKRMVHA